MQKKLKIAIISDMMDRKGRATALYTRKLAEGLLATERVELTLVHRKKTDNPLYKNVHEIIISKFPIPKIGWIIAETRFLWKTRNEFDIIHYPQESVYPLFWLSHAKIVMTMHSHLEGWRDFGMKSRYFFVWATLRFFAWRIDAVLCPVQTVRQSIRRFFKDQTKLHDVPLGVSEHFAHAPLKAHAQMVMKERYQIPVPYIFAPGRLDPQKNIPRVIEAYAHILPRKETLVVGAPQQAEESKRVQNLITTLKLEGKVISLPYVTDEDMPSAYAASEMVAYPSLHEGIGLPILEALATGVPLITSNVWSMPEVAGDAAIIVDPTEVTAIADGMRRILEDDELRSVLVANGKSRVSKYTWERMIEGTLSVYSSLS